MSDYQEHADFTFVYSKICYKLLFDENAEYEQDDLKAQCFQSNIKVRPSCIILFEVTFLKVLTH